MLNQSKEETRISIKHKLYYSEKETALYVQQYGLEMVRCKMHKKW